MNLLEILKNPETGKVCESALVYPNYKNAC